MIILTRLNGQPFALNPDLVERADATPDVVVTLVDGTKYVIREDLPELVRLVREYRASILLAAHALEAAEPQPPAAATGRQLRVLPGRRGEDG